MQLWSQIHSCQNGFLLHENSPNHNTKFSLSQNNIPHFPVYYGFQDQYLNPNILVENLWGYAGFCLFAITLDIPPTRSHSSWSWRKFPYPIGMLKPIGCSPPSPHAELGHYLFTDSSRLIWKRAQKMSAHHDLVSICYKKKKCFTTEVALSSFECCSSIVPLCCTCSVDGHAMIWRSSPLYSSWSKECNLWNTCWMLFCGKKSHPVTECWREINTRFPSGLRPLTILFPCQPLEFCFVSHWASPGTLMNSTQTAQRS